MAGPEYPTMDLALAITRRQGVRLRFVREGVTDQTREADRESQAELADAVSALYASTGGGEAFETERQEAYRLAGVLRGLAGVA